MDWPKFCFSTLVTSTASAPTTSTASTHQSRRPSRTAKCRPETRSRPWRACIVSKVPQPLSKTPKNYVPMSAWQVEDTRDSSSLFFVFLLMDYTSGTLWVIIASWTGFDRGGINAIHRNLPFTRSCIGCLPVLLYWKTPFPPSEIIDTAVKAAREAWCERGWSGQW